MSTEPSREAVSEFAREVVERVRDLALDDLFLTIEGGMHSAPAAASHDLAAVLTTDERRAVLRRWTSYAVDLAMWHFLFYLQDEAEDGRITFSFRRSLNDPPVDLSEASDSLAAELLAERDGWITRFSKHPMPYLSAGGRAV